MFPQWPQGLKKQTFFGNLFVSREALIHEICITVILQYKVFARTPLALARTCTLVNEAGSNPAVSLPDGESVTTESELLSG